ncbi:MAG: TatD family hydrolase [Vicinamibacterales bacterium]
MIDSHCHIAGAEFAGDLDAVVARARAAGVERCLVILAAEDEAEHAQAAAVAAAWPEAHFAVGVHPHHAHLFAGDPAGAAALVARRLDERPDIRAVGEIGLDYHYDFSPREAQQAVFRAQLRLARERGLPVVLHVREAEADALRILGEEGGVTLRGVFHCFSGTRDEALRAVETGFYVSIPGIVTFPKAGALRDAVAVVPPDRLLIETDSPYLAPVPNRGKRNEPAHVARVLDTVSGLTGMAPDALGQALVANYDRLFGR